VRLGTPRAGEFRKTAQYLLPELVFSSGFVQLCVLVLGRFVVHVASIEHAAEGFCVTRALLRALLHQLPKQLSDSSVFGVHRVRLLEVCDRSVELQSAGRCRRDEGLRSPEETTGQEKNREPA
jgi:hypothetical protein